LRDSNDCEIQEYGTPDDGADENASKPLLTTGVTLRRNGHLRSRLLFADFLLFYLEER